ncbi:MAG: hypothetical protein AAGJ34_06230 [Pseudomonadota bacterium]
MIAYAIIAEEKIDPSTALFLEMRDYVSRREIDYLTYPKHWTTHFLRPSLFRRHRFQAVRKEVATFFSGYQFEDAMWYFPHALKNYVPVFLNAGLGSRFSIMEEGKSHYIFRASENDAIRNDPLNLQVLKRAFAKLRYKVNLGSKSRHIPADYISPFAEIFYAFDRRAFASVPDNKLHLLEIKTAFAQMYRLVDSSDARDVLLPLDKLEWLEPHAREEYFGILKALFKTVDTRNPDQIIVKKHPKDPSITEEYLRQGLDFLPQEKVHFLANTEAMEEWFLRRPNGLIVTGVTSLVLYAKLMGLDVISIVKPMKRMHLIRSQKTTQDVLDLVETFGIKTFDTK